MSRCLIISYLLFLTGCTSGPSEPTTGSSTGSVDTPDIVMQTGSLGRAYFSPSIAQKDSELSVTILVRWLRSVNVKYPEPISLELTDADNQPLAPVGTTEFEGLAGSVEARARISRSFKKTERPLQRIRLIFERAQLNWTVYLDKDRQYHFTPDRLGRSDSEAKQETYRMR
jgi:hypothetical protein